METKHLNNNNRDSDNNTNNTDHTNDANTNPSHCNENSRASKPASTTLTNETTTLWSADTNNKQHKPPRTVVSRTLVLNTISGLCKTPTT